MGPWSSIDRLNSLLFILLIVHFYFNLCLVVTKCLHSRTNLKKFPRSQPSQVVIKFSFQGTGQFEVATILVLGHINWNYLFYLSETFVLNGIPKQFFTAILNNFYFSVAYFCHLLFLLCMIPAMMRLIHCCLCQN